jgi:general secretion pathway protein G
MGIVKADMATKSPLPQASMPDPAWVAFGHRPYASLKLSIKSYGYKIAAAYGAVGLPGRRQRRGFTLVELMLAVGVAATLAAIAIPSYTGYLEKMKVSQAIANIKEIEVMLERFKSNNSRLPATLEELPGTVPEDPWKRPYEYLNIETSKGKGKLRKDHKENPLNTDFDLYSTGKNGESKTQIDNKDSRDDIIRARNGGYVGLAADY